MNVLDRTIAFFNPTKALQRQVARNYLQIINSGYSEGGASTVKKSMRGYTANSASPEEDIDMNLDILRTRSRDMYMNAPLATAAIKTNRTNIVGAGLMLKARIDSEALGISEEQADQWEKEVEREFQLWSSSIHCDALKINDFFDLQQLALLGWLMNGEAIALLKYQDPTLYMPYGLRVHLIEADRLCTPNIKNTFSVSTIEGQNGENKITSGIEVDENGAVVAYHICNRYPQSTINFGKSKEWIRVEAFGEKTGMPNVLHIFESERAEQRRGVPILAPVIEPLKMITRYTEAELMASVVAGMFTIFVKSEGPASDMPLGSMIPDEQQVAAGDPTVYEMGNGAINVLNPGESIEVANPGRPNANFDGFVNALCRYIGAALEIPQELLQKSFNASYSASRAALLEAWKMFRMRRTWISKKFCQPIYEQWLLEAVASGRIKAPGFFNDPAIRKAWSRAEWNGPAPGQIDPVKEVTAAIKRIDSGLSTRERETMELTGGDFDRNIKQLQRENELMKGINPVKETQISEGGGEIGEGN